MKVVRNKMEAFIADKEIWGYAISHADNIESANWYAEQMEKLTAKKPIFINEASPVLIANVGPGVVALSVLLK